ncbi:MAG: hypothetical protein Q8918_04430 [Bacteroidota bacterium]|nr:hypothetical protein [Bacteroidota bacterium]MDP4212753.1 hypothetical protein [Bacteroidota bacterium]MDP4249342.1 hypothetical protein [Bacteroidota bacterium]
MISSAYKHPIVHTIRLSVVSILLLAVTVLAFASKGGGDKKKHKEFENNFTPINAASSFTLKRTPAYSGTLMSFQPQSDNRISLNAMITYQRGNTTFILPYQYKVNIGPVNCCGKTNLQFLGVKIQIPK